MRHLETTQDMKAYIERSNLSQHAKEYYGITALELSVLYNSYKKDPFNALCLTFELGKANGYRAAKSER